MEETQRMRRARVSCSSGQQTTSPVSYGSLLGEMSREFLWYWESGIPRSHRLSFRKNLHLPVRRDRYRRLPVTTRQRFLSRDDHRRYGRPPKRLHGLCHHRKNNHHGQGQPALPARSRRNRLEPTQNPPEMGVERRGNVYEWELVPLLPFG